MDARDLTMQKYYYYNTQHFSFYSYASHVPLSLQTVSLHQQLVFFSDVEEIDLLISLDLYKLHLFYIVVSNRKV